MIIRPLWQHSGITCSLFGRGQHKSCTRYDALDTEAQPERREQVGDLLHM